MSVIKWNEEVICSSINRLLRFLLYSSGETRNDIKKKEIMCRYAAYSYKSHYACFNCKKGFKRRLLIDITENKKAKSKEFNCPQCGQLMVNVGKDCEVPKKSQKQKWKVLKVLSDLGIGYHSCGCSGPGYIPKELDELKVYLEKNKSQYEQCYQSLLKEEIYNQAEIKKRNESLTHLSKKAKEIEGVIKSL